MFTADAEPGRLGIFQVTAVNRMSHFTQTLFRVDFTLKYYVDQVPAIFTNLQQKVVKTVNWVVEDYAAGGDGLIASEEYATRLDLRQFFYAQAENYVETFYSTEHSTLVVPGQVGAIYDPYLIDAVFSTLDFEHTPALARVHKYAIDTDDLYRSTSPYHPIISTNRHKLSTCFTQAGMSAAQQYARNYRARTIAFTSLTHVVTPKDGQYAQRYAGFVRTFDDGAFVANATAYTETHTDVNNSVIPVLTPFNPSSYLFGSKVRALTGYDSLFEKLIYTFLTTKTVNIDELSKVCEALAKAHRIEAFYYLPVVFALIRHTLKY